MWPAILLLAPSHVNPASPRVAKADTTAAGEEARDAANMVAGSHSGTPPGVPITMVPHPAPRTQVETRFSLRNLEYRFSHLLSNSRENYWALKIFESLCHEIVDLVVAWRYLDPVSSYIYQPVLVFKKISFLHLFDASDECACQKAVRLKAFLDPATRDEVSKHSTPAVHVRTMNTSIVQHKELRRAISHGMNHIPLMPTSIARSVAIVMEAFDQLTAICQLGNLDFPIEEAPNWLRNTCCDRLNAANRKNS